MSDAQVIKDLKAAEKAISDDFARKGLARYRTYVTITGDDLGAAMASGYRLVRKNSDRGINGTNELPIIQKRSFQAEGHRHIALIYKEYENKRGYTVNKRIFQTQNKIAITMEREIEAFFQFVKKLQIDFVDKKLGDKGGLTTAADVYRKEEGTDIPKNMTPEQRKKLARYANKSEVAMMKRGTEKLHKGKTTVGMARLAMIKQWLSKSKFYSDFVSDKQAWKTINDKFGKTEMFFETTGMPQIGKAEHTIDFSLKETKKVGMRLGDTDDNYSKSELRDYGNMSGPLQKALLKWAKQQDWWEKEGSNSLKKDSILAVRASMLSKVTNGKRGLLKTKMPKPGKRPAKSKTNSTKGKTPNIRNTGKYPAPLKAKKARSNAGNQQGASLYTVMAMISQKLPETVRKNMGAPRLENQTGTFANSVKMTDVIHTPQGYPSFGYTYAKEPYQVYETGSSGNWATPERDPRRLIDASIREIAAGFALGRFYTRRE